jgi:hypothetical protein
LMSMTTSTSREVISGFLVQRWIRLTR